MWTETDCGQLHTDQQVCNTVTPRCPMSINSRAGSLDILLAISASEHNAGHANGAHESELAFLSTELRDSRVAGDSVKADAADKSIGISAG